MNDLLKQGTPKEAQLKGAMDKIADLQAEDLLRGYKTASQIAAKLTKQQREHLQNMDASELWNVWHGMMSNMSVNQMSQMMRYMYTPAGAGMMNCGGGMSGMMMSGMMGRRR